MRRLYCLIMTLMFAALLFGCGCKQRVEPAEHSINEEVETVLNEVEIRELQLPERDPFVAAGWTGSSNFSSSVKPEGRNPFTEVSNIVILSEDTESPDDFEASGLPDEPGDILEEPM